jgi:predicted O-methyltransferase YrrM
MRRAVPAPQRRAALLLGAPPGGGGALWSAVGPELTHAHRVSSELLDLVLTVAARAREVTFPEIRERAGAVGSPYGGWSETYPGEHYRFLAGLAACTSPNLVIEIGTLTGASALALSAGAPSARVVTFDVTPWDEFPDTLLCHGDFASGRLQQIIGNLGEDSCWDRYVPLFEEADIVLLDGPKDGVFESIMLDRLAGVRTRTGFVLVVDDIKFPEMIDPWLAFCHPKIDVTSFAHWSGTGVAAVPASVSP